MGVKSIAANGGKLLAKPYNKIDEKTEFFLRTMRVDVKPYNNESKKYIMKEMDHTSRAKKYLHIARHVIFGGTVKNEESNSSVEQINNTKNNSMANNVTSEHVDNTKPVIGSIVERFCFTPPPAVKTACDKKFSSKDKPGGLRKLADREPFPSEERRIAPELRILVWEGGC